MGSAAFCSVTQPASAKGSTKIASRFAINDPVSEWSSGPHPLKVWPEMRISSSRQGYDAYFPQTCEPDVQTKGTVMPVQQVV
jgi:hypothetical protein